MIRSRLPGACLCLAFAGLLVACRPEPPPTEQRPEPQAARTELRDAIQAPQQRAAGAEDAVLQGADRQRAQMEAAEGG